MPGFPSADERRQTRRYYALVEAPDRNLRQRIDVTDIVAPLGERLLGSLDVDMRARLAALPERERHNIYRLKQGSETPLFRSASGGQPILSDRDHGRLVEHDALPANVDERVGRAQIDGQVAGEVAAEELEHSGESPACGRHTNRAAKGR